MRLRTDHQDGQSHGARPRFPLGYVVTLVACCALPVIVGAVVAVVVAFRAAGGAA